MAIAERGANGIRFMVWVGVPYCASLATDQPDRKGQGPRLSQSVTLRFGIVRFSSRQWENRGQGWPVGSQACDG